MEILNPNFVSYRMLPYCYEPLRMCKQLMQSNRHCRKKERQPPKICMVFVVGPSMGKLNNIYLFVDGTCIASLYRLGYLNRNNLLKNVDKESDNLWKCNRDLQSVRYLSSVKKLLHYALQRIT